MGSITKYKMLFVVVLALFVAATVAKPADLLGRHNNLENYEYKYVLDRVMPSEKSARNPLTDYTFIDPEEDSLRKSFLVVSKNRHVPDRMTQSETNRNPLADYTFIDPEEEDSLRKSFLAVSKSRHVINRMRQSETNRNPFSDYTFIDPEEEDNLRKSFLVASKNRHRFHNEDLRNYVVVLDDDNPVERKVVLQHNREPINTNRFLLGGILSDTPEVVAARKMHLEAYLEAVKRLGH